MIRSKQTRQPQRSSATRPRFPLPSGKQLAAEFGVGDGSDTIHPVDLCGLMLAALQGVGAFVQRQEQAIRRLSNEVARCRRALATPPAQSGRRRPKGAA